MYILFWMVSTIIPLLLEENAKLGATDYSEGLNIGISVDNMRQFGIF